MKYTLTDTLILAGAIFSLLCFVAGIGLVTYMFPLPAFGVFIILIGCFAAAKIIIKFYPQILDRI